MRARVLVLVLAMVGLGQGPAQARVGATSSAMLMAGSGEPTARRGKKRKKRRRKKRPRRRATRSSAPAHATVEALPARAALEAPATGDLGSKAGAIPVTKVAPAMPAPGKLPTQYTAVAMLPLVGAEVTAELLGAIETALLREVDEAEGMQVVTPADVANDLRTTGLDAAGCAEDVACIARVGRYARAQLALRTRVVAIGGTLNVSLRLVDTVAKREISRVADTVSEDAQLRAAELHRLAVQLLAPETYVGSLAVACQTAGAEIYIDDKLVGVAPLREPLVGLRAGPHILRVTKLGYSDLYRFVDVIYKRSAAITVDLETKTISGLLVELESTSGFGTLFVAALESGIEIRVDGEPVAVTPLGEPLKVAAGRRRVSFRKHGLPPAAREIEIEVGRRAELVLRSTEERVRIEKMQVVPAASPLLDLREIVATPAASMVSTTRATGVARRAGEPRWPVRLYAGMGVAALGAGGLATMGYFSSRVAAKDRRARQLEKDAARASPTELESIVEEQRRIDDEAEGALAAQWIAAGVGGGLVAVGAALILWDLVVPGTEPPVLVGTDGGQVMILGRW